MLELEKISTATKCYFNKIIFFFNKVGLYSTSAFLDAIGASCKYPIFLLILDLVFFFFNKSGFIILALPISHYLPDYYEPKVITWEGDAFFPNRSGDQSWEWDDEWYDGDHFEFWFNDILTWEEEVIPYEFDKKWKGAMQTHLRKSRIIGRDSPYEFHPFFLNDGIDGINEKVFHALVEVPVAWYVRLVESSYAFLKKEIIHCCSIIDFDEYFDIQLSPERGPLLYFFYKYAKKIARTAVWLYSPFTLPDFWSYIPNPRRRFSGKLHLIYIKYIGIWWLAKRYYWYRYFSFYIKYKLRVLIIRKIVAANFPAWYLLCQFFKILGFDTFTSGIFANHILYTILALYFFHFSVLLLTSNAASIKIFTKVYVFFFITLSYSVFILLRIILYFPILINYYLSPYYMDFLYEIRSVYISNKEEFLLFMQDAVCWCKEFWPMCVHIVKNWDEIKK